MSITIVFQSDERFAHGKDHSLSEKTLFFFFFALGMVFVLPVAYMMLTLNSISNS